MGRVADRRMSAVSERYMFTRYFEQSVLLKRPYLHKEWCIHVIEKPIAVEPQDDGRIRFWGVIPELAGRPLRVVTLSDGVTIHNAFPDRGFRHEDQLLP